MVSKLLFGYVEGSYTTWKNDREMDIFEFFLINNEIINNETNADDDRINTKARASKSTNGRHLKL